MLGAQYAVDAVGLEDELDERCDGFGWCHAAMLAPLGANRIGSTPEPHPDSSDGLAAHST